VRFRHLIFDLDGTLVDSAQDLVASANHTLRRLGLQTLTSATLVGFVGDGARRLIERAVAAAGGATDQASIDRALGEFLDHYCEHLLDATALYPGIADTVAALVATGRTLSVATNKPEGLARQILDGLGVGEAFRDVIGGDSLPTRKPDPAGVLELVRRSGIAVDRTLLVGDSPVDIATARAAGIAVCTVSWGFGASDALRDAEPDFAVVRAQEILAL